MSYLIYYIKLYNVIIVPVVFLLFIWQIIRIVKLKKLKNNGKKVEAMITGCYIKKADKSQLEQGEDATAREYNKKQVVLDYSYLAEGRKKPFKRRAEIPEWLYKKIWNKTKIDVIYNEKKPRRHVIEALLPGKIGNTYFSTLVFLVLLVGVIYVAYVL